MAQLTYTSKFSLSEIPKLLLFCCGDGDDGCGVAAALQPLLTHCCCSRGDGLRKFAAGAVWWRLPLCFNLFQALRCRCAVAALSLRCRCAVAALSLRCRCAVAALLLRCRCAVVAVSSLHAASVVFAVAIAVGVDAVAVAAFILVFVDVPNRRLRYRCDTVVSVVIFAFIAALLSISSF